MVYYISDVVATVAMLAVSVYVYWTFGYIETIPFSIVSCMR